MMTWDSPARAARSLLPLGRRWPAGPDEGAFVLGGNEVAPHQFGLMTYERAIKVELVASWKRAPVSHGLTSSPPRGEGSAECAP
jgi:hypothetical protein